MDIVYTTAAGFFVLHNDGSGAFDGIVATYFSDSPIVADFDGDGLSDLAAGQVTGTLGSMKGLGDGTFEFFSNGTKLLQARGAEGRIEPAAVVEIVCKRTDIHFPKPRVLSITQATELGTVYTIDQLHALQEVAQRFDLKIHMDGARFANAVATLGCAPKEVTWQAGVDVLCFGGTKNGMAVGEAVIFFDTALALDFDYRCKQAGQLASKMRFLSAPWVGLLETGAWLRNARHANACAHLLAERIADLPDAALIFPVEANAVFLQLPADAMEALRARGWRFYTFIGGGARFMFAWDTDVARVEALAADIRDALGRPALDAAA